MGLSRLLEYVGAQTNRNKRNRQVSSAFVRLMVVGSGPVPGISPCCGPAVLSFMPRRGEAAGTNESTTPPGRQRNPENRTIQKTGQQKSPTLLAAYQQGQAFGVWAWGLARRLSGRTPETVAERGGFEPPMQFPTYTLSRRAPSTTRTSHRVEVRKL